jgi:hypothetical protein
LKPPLAGVTAGKSACADFGMSTEVASASRPKVLERRPRSDVSAGRLKPPLAGAVRREVGDADE